MPGSKESGNSSTRPLPSVSWRAAVNPLLPMPLLYSLSYDALPAEAKPTTTSPARICELSITSERKSRAVTVESTITVLTRSPTSAVSPPVDTMCTPKLRISFNTSSVPLIRAVTTSPGITRLFLPIVLDNIILSTTPTHNRSSVFITIASCATPFHTETSPVRFQYMYAREALVPAPSACMTMQCSGLPVRSSGTTLQNAFGYNPALMSLMALCTSSFPAETPRRS
mmetsp:Transcript_6947/g.19748  ORF Transcript_6947/g.19748 Transcript_6947/m.19748 type:complete len:227 (-) Transcript_6947:111-791(-)